jgi:hypothetical protein
MSQLPKPRFFFKGFPEDVRFRAHSVPESLEIARGTLYEAWFRALKLSPYLEQGWTTGQWLSAEAQETGKLFGDLRGEQFDAWWMAKGFTLFAETRAFRHVSVLGGAGEKAHGPQASSASLALEVPLDVSPATLKRQFDALLRQHHPQYQNFDRWGASSARVRMENRKLTSVSINLFLKVYEAWRQRGGPDQQVRLYDIGEALRLNPRFSVTADDTPYEASDKHRKMSLTVSEYLEKAKNLVAHASEGYFPRTDDHPWIERLSRTRRGEESLAGLA